MLLIDYSAPDTDEITEVLEKTVKELLLCNGKENVSIIDIYHYLQGMGLMIDLYGEEEQYEEENFYWYNCGCTCD